MRTMEMQLEWIKEMEQQVNEKLETLSKYPELQKALTNCLNEWNEDEEEDEVFTIRISCHDVTGTCHSMPYLTHNIYL